MQTETPFVVKHVDDGPAPAWTDSVTIFIRGRHGPSETQVLVKHESAHIWLRHKQRQPAESRGHDSAKAKAWAIATEVEIARNIYSASDIRIINAPRSSIRGGYIDTSLPDCPYSIAEDVYQWLLDHPDDLDSQPKSGTCGGHGHDSDSDDGDDNQTVEDLVAGARQLADDMGLAAQAVSIAAKIVSYRPKVSLASELDALLASRLDRKKSYRRPSRRENDFIDRGRFTVHTRPAVRIYIDRSGSFTPQKTQKAQSIIARLLRQYGARVVVDVLFFGNDKLCEKDFPGGGNTPYDLVYSDLILVAPVVAIIVTDDDPVSSNVLIVKESRVLCIPVDCQVTNVSRALGGRDVVL
jgi:hypothetical protein